MTDGSKNEITKHNDELINAEIVDSRPYEFTNHIIAEDQETKYKNNAIDSINQQFIRNVEYIHCLTMQYANSLGIVFWQKNNGSSIYFRNKPFSKEEKIRSDDDFYTLLGHIKVYNTVKDACIGDNVYILVKSLLYKVHDDVFAPFTSYEFYRQDNVNYRNTFKYTYLLSKMHRKREKQLLLGITPPVVDQRLIFYYQDPSRCIPNLQFGLIMQPQPQYIQSPSIQEQIQKSIIENFIRFISQDDNQFNYIMNWLAQFFQTLNKSNTALVLIGDTEVTDILVNKIIRPIFASKKEYFSTINDDTLKKTNETIIKDKIFYHIGELSTANAKDRRTSRLVMDILKSNSIFPADALENNETYIYGQLLITSNKDTPYPFLKDSYSHCTVFKVKYLDTVLKKLAMNRLDFEEMIQNDLNNFSNILAQHQIDRRHYAIAETAEKDALPSMKNGILRTRELEAQIEFFTQKIREKNLAYFENVKKEDSALYKELEYNFKEDMIAQPLLSDYFNLIYGDIIFSENSYLLEILKEKAEMFKKAPDDKSKCNGKKRYKIV